MRNSGERYFWGCGRRTCIMPIVLSSTCATSASPAPPGLVPVPTRPFMHLSYREWKESSNSAVSSMRLIIFNLTKISDVTRPQHVVFPRNVFAFSYTLITIDKIRTITIGKWVMKTLASRETRSNGTTSLFSFCDSAQNLTSEKHDSYRLHAGTSATSPLSASPVSST